MCATTERRERTQLAQVTPATADDVRLALRAAGIDVEAGRASTRNEFTTLVDASPYDLILGGYDDTPDEPCAPARTATIGAAETPGILVTPSALDVKAFSPGSVPTDWESGDGQFRQRMEARRAVEGARPCRARSEAERRFVELADAVSDVYFTADAQLKRILYINAAYEHVWADRCERLYRHPGSFLDRVVRHDRRRVTDHLARVAAGRTEPELELELQLPTGEARWVRVLATAVRDELGAVVRINGTARDVTRLKRAETRMRESEADLRLILDATAEGVCGLDLNGRCTFSNAAAARILGFEDGVELLGQSMHRLWHRARADGSAYPDDACPIRGAAQHGTLVHASDEVFWRRDGSAVPVEYWARPIVRDGIRVGAVVTFIDISVGRAALDRLAASEERYRTLSEASFDGLASSVDGVIAEVNAGFANIFGYEPDELVGQPMAQFVGEPSPLDTRAMTKGRDGPREFVGSARNGAKVVIEVAGRTRTAAGSELRMIAVRDLTQRRALEAQFLQSQKMESIGRLAGGVAHDFNNLLTVITSYTSLLIEDMMCDDPRREDLRCILQAACGAASLTRQLLAFSRQQRAEPTFVTLDGVVENTQRMLQRVIGEDIELIRASSEEEAGVCMDPGQVEQIIMNLAVNARDAMPAGGTLFIGTRVEYRDGSSIPEEWSATGGAYSVLTVRDTGTGMDATTRARLFEPFFTTKEAGKGTGLGLATVYGIVQQGGGFIEVDTMLGRGTEFRLYLQREQCEAVVGIAEVMSAAAGGRSEAILLVEDCDAVRIATAAVLVRSGYRVTAVAGGAAAVQAASGDADRFDLLVTDVVMPGLDGARLREELVRLSPGIRALFISGYTNDLPLRAALEASGANFLQKPFTPTQLAQKVRETLDAVPVLVCAPYASRQGASGTTLPTRPTPC